YHHASGVFTTKFLAAFELPLEFQKTKKRSESGMILPIVAYGNPILRKVARDIDENYPDLKKLIEDMWETMYASNGVGLAAPQINREIRLFVMDSAQIVANLDEEERKDENYPADPVIRQVFINAHIVEEHGDDWAYNEGCLSIPRI